MPDIFAGEEFFPLLGVDHLGEDRLLALGREMDRLLGALDPVLDEAPLLDVRDVHVFEADVAAVGLLQHAHDLAHRGLLEAQRPEQEDRAVEVGVGEAMIGWGEVRRHVHPRQAERVEPRREVAAHAIGADQHHRADRIVGSAADLVGAGASRGRAIGDGLPDLLDRRLRRVEPEVQLVELLDRPVRPLPARARLGRSNMKA